MTLLPLLSLPIHMLPIHARVGIFFQLTGLVTSFYATLSEHYNEKFYMEQLKEIGFLAHFECLLNSTGNKEHCNCRH